MKGQTKAWQGVSSAAGAVLTTLGAGIVMGSLERAAGHVAQLVASLVCLMPAALPSVILAAGQTFPACGLAHALILDGLFRVLVLSWPAIVAIAGA